MLAGARHSSAPQSDPRQYRRSATFSSTWSASLGGDRKTESPLRPRTLLREEPAGAGAGQSAYLLLDGRRLVRSGNLRTVSVVRKPPPGAPLDPFGLVGIGISFRPASDGSFIVADMTQGGGAVDSGVKIGDVIHAVDGKSATSLSTHELVQTIKGDAASSVCLVLEATSLESALLGLSPGQQRLASPPPEPAPLLPAKPGADAVEVGSDQERLREQQMKIRLQEQETGRAGRFSPPSPSGRRERLEAESVSLEATCTAVSSNTLPSQSTTAKQDQKPAGNAQRSSLSNVAQPHTQILFSCSAVGSSSTPSEQCVNDEARTETEPESPGQTADGHVHVRPARASRSTRTAQLPQTSRAALGENGTNERYEHLSCSSERSDAGIGLGASPSGSSVSQIDAVHADSARTVPAGSLLQQQGGAAAKESEALTLSMRPEPLLRPLQPEDHAAKASRIEADVYLHNVRFPVPETQHQVEKRILRGDSLWHTIYSTPRK